MIKYRDTDEVLEQIRKKLGIKSLDYLLEAERQIVDAIQSAPSIDIVRCKECKHGEYREDFNDYECHSSGCGLVYDADFFCADGEREGE